MLRSVPAFFLLIALIACAAACNRDPPASAEQRATEYSSDQPLTPSPSESTQPETPAQTQRDVAAAEQQADETRSQVVMASDVTEAESAHKIQIQKCEALAADARLNCIAKADQELAAARERAKIKLESKTR